VLKAEIIFLCQKLKIHYGSSSQKKQNTPTLRFLLAKEAKSMAD
jgi:hypothetical protein